MRQIISEEVQKNGPDSDIIIVLKTSDGFSRALKNLEKGPAVSRVSPADSVANEEEQSVVVTQLAKGNGRYLAQIGDLVEIKYTAFYLPPPLRDPSPGAGRVPYDVSARAVNPTGSIEFVLGKQPFGQFPPAFDVACLNMRTDEKRRALVPPVLAYGEAGFQKFDIPPNAYIVYEIEMVLINAMK